MTKKEKEQFENDYEYNYTDNPNKLDRIVKKYKQISELSIYSTNIRISANEYVKYLNDILLNYPGTKVENQNSGKKSSGTFAIKKNGVFIVNQRFVKKCISNARNGKGLLNFAFFWKNIVLDKLDQSLSSRKQSVKPLQTKLFEQPKK
jgi:hypothetical protein